MANYIAYGEMTRDSTEDESSPFDSFEDSAVDAGDLPTGIQEWIDLYYSIPVTQIESTNIDELVDWEDLETTGQGDSRGTMAPAPHDAYHTACSLETPHESPEGVGMSGMGGGKGGKPPRAKSAAKSMVDLREKRARVRKRTRFSARRKETRKKSNSAQHLRLLGIIENAEQGPQEYWYNPHSGTWKGELQDDEDVAKLLSKPSGSFQVLVQVNWDGLRFRLDWNGTDFRGEYAVDEREVSISMATVQYLLQDPISRTHQIAR
ncbi:hypothetical protein NKR23_g10900 [Pleurostoma richardsiae]|uniref:Uncharacterized protein n=1 Tax=Pleurostoma richardsiae TaxID=41990 RepID=A0AA38RBG8_9PEZI|nr:hypothetical protein NKR23_g10900 [Pleurostoma richardsiae]